MSIRRIDTGARMSQAVVHGDTVYTAGQVAQNAPGGSVTEQTEDILNAIDRLLAEHDVAFLIAPTVGPAWPIDLIGGDHYDGSIGAGSLAAIAGYPHLTVPMGHVEGLPVGLSIMGAKWADHAVLKAGAAYERARTVALPKPGFGPWQAPQL